MEYFWPFSWILIPVLAILVGAFKEWLKFKEKQQQLGFSAEELEKTVAAQQKELEATQRRLQNLEAIVTSQMWDVVHDDALPQPEKERALAGARVDLAFPEDDTSDAERTARLARRLRT
ncbi:MAG TPA: hypothetical protein VKP65_13075 [Rhodothermales bacterium]|nr:hypothetical protein [Rhodothermales bacterium]